jgi:hypothetical protein
MPLAIEHIRRMRGGARVDRERLEIFPGAVSQLDVNHA